MQDRRAAPASRVEIIQCRVLLKQGVKDMVRNRDRMSGTSFGTVVLHIAPESAIGRPTSAVDPAVTPKWLTGGRQIEKRLAERKQVQRTSSAAVGSCYETCSDNEGCDFGFCLRKSKAPPS